VKRFAAILMFLGAVLAGGGARFAHVMVAHTGASESPSACGSRTSCRSHSHAYAPSSAQHGTARPNAHQNDGCAICDELAALTPTLCAPCTLVCSLELLAVLDAVEASQIADPAPIAAISARPPPARA